MALLVVGVIASIGFSVYLLLRVWDVEGMLHTAEQLHRLDAEEDQVRFENVLRLIAECNKPKDNPVKMGRTPRNRKKMAG